MDYKNLLHKTVSVRYKNKKAFKTSYGLVTKENNDNIILTHTFKEKKSLDTTIISIKDILSIKKLTVDEIG